MKIRTDFVTNSSSSSFIITNTTDEIITGRDIALLMESDFEYYKKRSWAYTEETFEDFIENADCKGIVLNPHESISFECGDHGDDGIFENVIHYVEDVVTTICTINFEESHH